MLNKLSNIGLTILVLSIFVLVIQNFYVSYSKILDQSLSSLFKPVYKPEIILAKSLGPQFQILEYISKSIPDSSIVCFPENYYKIVFNQDEAYFHYFWLNRSALPGEDTSCQYKIELLANEDRQQININIINLKKS
ncbi:MAG: hypothetical protein WCV81_01770 [Microgenomates group bacterium]|jgi:hypothetical protein